MKKNKRKTQDKKNKQKAKQQVNKVKNHTYIKTFSSFLDKL